MATSKTVSIKLLIDTKANRVLFAESGKDFVDFLFNFLSLPVGTLVRLLTAGGMVGCLGNLYKSVQNIDETYILSSKNKKNLLTPTVQNIALDVPLLPPNIFSSATTSPKFYRCNGTYEHCHRNIANTLNVRCSQCGGSLNLAMNIIGGSEVSSEEQPSSEASGFVKGVVTYMIMDNLVVTPMSTISSITMLNKFQVKEVGALQEKVVEVGMNEGVKLLKASLASNTVFSDVFLAKKKSNVSV